MTFFCGRSLAGGRKCPLTISFYFFFFTFLCIYQTLLSKATYSAFRLYILFYQYVFSLGIEPTTFCAALQLSHRNTINSLMLAVKFVSLFFFNNNHSLRLSDSDLTCIVETNSLSLTSHEDVYIYLHFSRQLIFLTHFISFNHSCHRFLSGKDSRYALKFQIKHYYINSGVTRWCFKILV